jgi:hypothetical protein
LAAKLLSRDEARRIAANVACQSRGVRHDKWLGRVPINAAPTDRSSGEARRNCAL